MNLFADNLGEQLAASLSGVPLVSVRLVPTKRELSALDRRTTRYVLTARVIPEADLIRVVTRLVATADGRHLWGETFDGTRTTRSLSRPGSSLPRWTPRDPPS